MTMLRTTLRSVEFSHPFDLNEVDVRYLPGTYEVETVEELIPGVSFAAYRRIRCYVSVPTVRGISAGRQIIEIEPRILDEALARDEALNSKIESVL